ncbi:MAG: exodeoxyribonuclease VII large subunit, partial [Clostridia bacterium]|nr:exodeoxyribonuclease VII large subunit [Clostridia bacterium]
AASISALNPLAVLSRGYSAVFDDGGRVIKSVNDTRIGETVVLKLSDGAVVAIVDDIRSDSSEK